MTDRHDLPAPPAVAPLDDATRARLRARVVAGLDEAPDRPPRRWVVPAAAAAAVLAVVGVGAAVALPDDPATPVGPAAQESSSPPSQEPSPRSADPTGPPDPACEREVEGVLRGAEPVVTTLSETGATTFYVTDDRWTLCSTHGGRPTVHRPRALDTPDDQAAYGVSSLFPRARTSTYVAGGLLPDGVTDAEILYGFPDGHREPAATVTDDAGRTWWEMEYTVTGGVLNGGGSVFDLDPIEVDVAYGDTAETYELTWSVRDTCLQANHGC
ncbi:hypothetical protein [uncultured Nocardioides sp.]|uniref:hypothetical protein n=1 Tax=uncultured Nocardioides sp. TaxID=198441 RepID=UPI0026094892|nr:hypothetical protein [uncultured Nocardioides sp.]